MKLFSTARSFGAGFALVMLGFVAHATIPLPGDTGPSLGDPSANIYSLTNAITLNNQMGYTSGISVSQTSAQANCTQLNNNPLQEIKTSASTGYVCLPTATPGRQMQIGNATTQTIDIYGSAATFVSGTQDTINGTTGTTPYTGLTSGKNADCFSPTGGAWYCTAGS